MFWFTSRRGFISSAWRKIINNKWQFFFQELNLVLHLPAKSFKEIVKTNVIQNWKRKNFCNKRFYLDFHVSYHNVMYTSIFRWCVKMSTDKNDSFGEWHKKVYSLWNYRTLDLSLNITFSKNMTTPLSINFLKSEKNITMFHS